MFEQQQQTVLVFALRAAKTCFVNVLGHDGCGGGGGG
jgi:carbonic anhydrase